MKLIRHAAIAAALAGLAGLAGAQGAGQAPAQTPGVPPCATTPCGPGAGPGPMGGPGEQGYRHHHRGAMFACMDTDRDGAISRAELLAAQQRQLERFDKADANGDGKITRDEMRGAWRQWQEANPDGCRPGRGGPGAGPAPAKPAS